MLASDHLSKIKASIKGSTTLGELVHKMEKAGFGLLIFILSLPFLQPFPSGGLSSVFGTVTLILSIQVFRNRDSVWLPMFISRRSFQESTSQRLMGTAERFFSYTEKLVKPRLEWVTNSHRTIGTALAFLSLVLIFPAPIPLANLITSFPMILLSLALVERDGMMAILGFAFTALCIAFHVVVLILGFEAIKKLWELFWPFLSS